MSITFTYIETDDSSCDYSGLSFKDVTQLIAEHNEHFGTNYQTISDYNQGEEYRQIKIRIQ